MKQYIIFIIIFAICFPYLASAQDTKWFEGIFNKFEQKVINPVQESVQNLPQDVASGVRYLKEKAREKKEAKKEEIKEGIKERARKWAQNKLIWLENKVLNPLKNKIQEGSSLIRKGFYKVKDYLVEIFKE